MATVSFEYFPPRSEKASSQLRQVVKKLGQFQPKFQSVTYGAGGSNQQGTLETVKDISNKSPFPVASHFTFTGSKKADIVDFADQLWNNDIRSLVALRGDDRDETGENVFQTTAEFVTALREIHPFEIAVSCYPETHPKAASRSADIQVLLDKQNAGATSAISQFFFDNSVFYDFVSEARAHGVTIPIIPGILPIYNFEKVQAMAEQCGTRIPQHVKDAFSENDCAGGSSTEVAAELLKAQVYDLAIAGFEEIHIYTLNKGDLAAKAASSFLEAHEVAEEHKKKFVA